MSRRKLSLFVGLAACLAALGLTAWLLWPRTAITRENADKIRVGMTLEEVEAILGGPARDETTGPVVRVDPPEFAPPDATGRRLRISSIDLRPHLEWHSDQVKILVHFATDGRVTDSTQFLMRRADEGVLDILRRWLGL